MIQHPAVIRTAKTVQELRSALREAREAGQTVGFVPTLGALHAGHLSLIEAADAECDLVVVSVFVNPTQFDEQADLLQYPRQERQDAELALAAGADLLFLPDVQEMYAPGHSTFVEVAGITERFEGAVRGSGHFRGMATIVCKLLNVVAADVAYFGRKDAQQVAVVRRMVADLDIPTRIAALPTVREPDGLALSSRNARLSAAEREQALGLHAALRAAERLAAAGETSGSLLLRAAREELSRFSLQVEYVELVDEQTFEPIDLLDRDALMLVAARAGKTRLIDNVALPGPGGGAQGSSADEEERGQMPDRSDGPANQTASKER